MPKSYIENIEDTDYTDDTDDTVFHWQSGTHMLPLTLTSEQVASGYHYGDCSDDVDALCREPSIQAQTDQWDADKLRDELDGYGAWGGDELSDHTENVKRMVWLACADVQDDPATYEAK